MTGIMDMLGNLGTSVQKLGAGAENLLGNPLVEGALATYLGAISQPKHTGLMKRLGMGGLEGLGAFEQARQQKQALPFEQALTQRAQSEATQKGLETQQLQKQMQPLSADMIAKLDAYKATTTNPQERSYIDLLEQQATAGLVTPQELDKAIESFDQAKRYMEMMKGQAAMTQAQYMPYFLQQFGMTPPPFATPGGMPAPMPSGAPPSAPPPSGSPDNVEPGVPFLVDGKTIALDTDGKFYSLEGGAWRPIS